MSWPEITQDELHQWLRKATDSETGLDSYNTIRIIYELTTCRAERVRLKQVIGFQANDPLGQRVHALQNQLAAAEAELGRLRKLKESLLDIVVHYG